MSSRQGRTTQRPPQQRTGEKTTEDETEIATLLGVLEDDDCREILEATADEPKSASELCDYCDLASSTAYRKIDQLTDAGLLNESVRLRQSGSHTSEYSLAMRSLEITLDDGLELTMTPQNTGLQIATAD